ncbi:RNA-directed DNA polymerase [Devosia naphthalenivorans]|uniref:RNA-directed DNA polymerase n=1 Tax=Devosia naphthalenivorans TaxID=2082392 RepID=UPI000D38F84C|nr:RNA-directed DNA polymerase [Devosia naphthalenivorans]
MFELVYLSEKADEVVDQLKTYDVSNFYPSHSVEALAPKSRYGFRIANQLVMLDALLLMAGTVEIAPDLENFKAPDERFGPFSYRFENKGDGSVLKNDRTYRDWIEFQREIAKAGDIEYVVFTDIADFYQRIYFHRIENVLRSASANKGVAALLEKIIKKIRAKQSYGIPVGGTASRFIAEAVLSDFDHALEAEEYFFTRFVDDIRIYIRKGESAYRSLAFAAEVLLSEGLTLNAQKTRVVTLNQYVEYLDDEGLDAFDETQRTALEALSNSLYFEEADEPDADELASLQALNLVDLLSDLLAAESWDFGKIRSILRALRITQNAECVQFIGANLELLLPFIKDVVLLLDNLSKSGALPAEFDITPSVVGHLRVGAGRSVPVIRAWLLELFIRRITPISAKTLGEIERVSELDGRQIILINATISNIAYFRKNKTRFDQFSMFEQYALIIGATCLPKDEYDTWVDAVRGGMLQPLDKSFCDWAKSKQGKFGLVITDLANLAQTSDGQS